MPSDGNLFGRAFVREVMNSFALFGAPLPPDELATGPVPSLPGPIQQRLRTLLRDLPQFEPPDKPGRGRGGPRLQQTGQGDAAEAEGAEAEEVAAGEAVAELMGAAVDFEHRLL